MSGSKTTVGAAMRLAGRVWGETFLKHVVLAYTRRRVSFFDLHVEGVESLLELQGQSYILVSNHILPRDRLLKIFALKPLQRFNHAIDSFVFQRIVYERTGKWIRVVAKYGRDDWYGSKLMRLLQRHVRQPLTQGQLEGVGYVPVDLKQGAAQRDFLRTADRLIAQREALLIFPEGDTFDEFQSDRRFQSGAAHLARRYRLPVLPAYISGSHTWRPGQRVDVRFGPRIPTEGLSKQQITAEIKCGITALQRLAAAEGAED